MWRESGALAALVPQLAAQPEVAFAAADHIPLPGDTRRLERVDARRKDRILSLFLDLASEAIRAALHDLRFSNADVRSMERLAGHWLALVAPVGAALARGTPDDGTIRQWAAVTGRTQLGTFLRLAEARWAAAREAGAAAPSRDRASSVYRRALRVAYRDPIELADLAVDGEDLQRGGIARGPELGKILRALLAWVVEEPARNTPDRLLERAAALARDARREPSDVER
jgi:tRNA nucleotidyltransferase (CCA-adding enzyme)